MPDVEKVMEGLEHCEALDCPRCPYYVRKREVPCPVYHDARAVIVAQGAVLAQIDKYVRELEKAVNGDGQNCVANDALPEVRE